MKKIMKSLAVAALCLFGVQTVISAEFAARYSELEKCEWKSENGTLLYQKYTPELKAGEKYPLIIFLHGAGERGDNNISQVAGQDAFLNLIFGPDGSKHSAYLIAPQCPSDKKWCEVEWGNPDSHKMPETPSYGMQLLHELLQSMKVKDQIDPNRIYVTGISMGGYGTFDFLVRYSDEIAAAVPVCGGADNEKLASMPELKKIPVWIFHGGADGVVKTQRSRNAFEALQKNGVNVQYTEYPGVGHGCWGLAYHQDGLVEWLFAQHK